MLVLLPFVQRMNGPLKRRDRGTESTACGQGCEDDPSSWRAYRVKAVARFGTPIDWIV